MDKFTKKDLDNLTEALCKHLTDDGLKQYARELVDTAYSTGKVAGLKEAREVFSDEG